MAVTWSIMSTQFDPDGWQYTTALDSPFWHFENNNSLCKSCVCSCRECGWYFAVHSAKRAGVWLCLHAPINTFSHFSFMVAIAVVVRRRAWKRELHKGAKSTKSGESHKTANSVPAAKTPPAPAPAAAAPAANQK